MMMAASAERHVARDEWRGWRPLGRSSSAPLLEGNAFEVSDTASARFATGARVFHIKFGYGTVAAVDGNKLDVEFDKAGRKKVVDSFVQRAPA